MYINILLTEIKKEKIAHEIMKSNSITATIDK